ncbi:hypothetical protein [Tumebacillus lipolyticus]|uniref:Uncharacterized protein n=1 Tax=Tumebacillus lipolyticus TaxID=1280370 RepID=A0ABW5A3N3_9BACL
MQVNRLALARMEWQAVDQDEESSKSVIACKVQPSANNGEKRQAGRAWRFLLCFAVFVHKKSKVFIWMIRSVTFSISEDYLQLRSSKYRFFINSYYNKNTELILVDLPQRNLVTDQLFDFWHRNL